MGSKRGNPFFERCHRLLMKLWEKRGSTYGMWKSQLLKGVPLLGAGSSLTMNVEVEEADGRIVGSKEVSKFVTDYLIQSQVISAIMRLVDEKEGWDGPKHVADHVYGIDYLVGSQLVNEFTRCSGRRAFDLMALSLPRWGNWRVRSRCWLGNIVEMSLRHSFGVKLAHGIMTRVLGETLGSLWRTYEGPDDVPGTYVHWLRHGTIYWCPDELPRRREYSP